MHSSSPFLLFRDLRGDIAGSVSVVVSRENRAAYLFLWRCSTEMTREESSEMPNSWESTRKDGELSVWAFGFVLVPGSLGGSSS